MSKAKDAEVNVVVDEVIVDEVVADNVVPDKVVPDKVGDADGKDTKAEAKGKNAKGIIRNIMGILAIVIVLVVLYLIAFSVIGNARYKAEQVAIEKQQMQLQQQQLLLQQQELQQQQQQPQQPQQPQEPQQPQQPQQPQDSASRNTWSIYGQPSFVVTDGTNTESGSDVFVDPTKGSLSLSVKPTEDTCLLQFGMTQVFSTPFSASFENGDVGAGFRVISRSHWQQLPPSDGAYSLCWNR